MPHVPMTFPMPPRWSSVVEVSLSSIQLNSSITSNLQRMPPERVQVEVPEGGIFVFGLVRGNYPSRPSRSPIIRRHDKRRPEDKLTLMPAPASQCGRQKLEPKQLRSLQFDSCLTTRGTACNISGLRRSKGHCVLARRLTGNSASYPNANPGT